jgi:hypothetical protein
VKTVDAALNVGISEGADEALGDAVALESRYGSVLGSHLAAVDKFKPSVPQARVVALEAEEALPGEHERGVLAVMVGVVIAAEAQYPLQRGRHRVIRQVEKDRRRQFKIPVEGRGLLGKTEPQQRSRKAFSVLPFGDREKVSRLRNAC